MCEHGNPMFNYGRNFLETKASLVCNLLKINFQLSTWYVSGPSAKPAPDT
jgi:hypothetical protein